MDPGHHLDEHTDPGTHTALVPRMNPGTHVDPPWTYMDHGPLRVLGSHVLDSHADPLDLHCMDPGPLKIPWTHMDPQAPTYPTMAPHAFSHQRIPTLRKRRVHS